MVVEWRFRKVDNKEVIKILDYCIDNNFKEFDIAPTYGYGIIDDIFSRYKNYKLKINTKFGYDSKRKFFYINFKSKYK